MLGIVTVPGFCQEWAKSVCKGDTHPIENRRRPSSPVSPLNALGFPDPHPSPWLRRWLYRSSISLLTLLPWQPRVWYLAAPLCGRPGSKLRSILYVRVLTDVNSQSSLEIWGRVLLCFLQLILENRYGPGVPSPQECACSFFLIDPKVRKIRNKASNCPEIFSSTLRMCCFFVLNQYWSPWLFCVFPWLKFIW